jgi:tetratricopeptide (TPR) repeat protein
MALRALRFIAPLGIALTLLCAKTARADDDDPEVTAQAKEHYKAGLDAYKAGKYDVAIRELKKAHLLKRLPPLLLNIGATYRKMGDLDLALHFYQKYLDEAPADAKDRPEVEKTISEIKAQKSSASASEEAPSRREEAPPSKDRGGEWNHNVIDAAPPDMPIDVRVTTSVMKGVKVFVYYRGSGQADFNSILMKRRGRDKVGRIPAEAVNGRALQYYIEAKDSAGTVVKSSGSQANPNIIMVEDGVKPVMLASMSRRGEREEEEPQDEEERPKRRKSNRDLDDESAPTTGHVDLTDDEPVRTPPRKKKGAGLSSLMIGGIATAAVGVGLVAAGGALVGISQNTAKALASDSQAPIDNNGHMIFYNNDPNAGASSQEKDLASRGKTMNTVGLVGIGLGSAAVVAGVSCIIADVVQKSQADNPPKRKHKKRRHRDEEDEEEESSWYLTPGVGVNGVSVSGGFTF